MSVTQTLSGQKFANHFYVQNNSRTAWTQANIDLLTSNTVAGWIATILTTQNHDLALVEVTAVDLTDAAGVTSVHVSGANGSAGTTDTNPNNVCMRLTFVIGLRVRGGRPGIYLGGFDSSLLADLRSWLTGSLATVLTQWNAFVGAIPTWAFTDGAARWCTVSYHAGHAVRPVPIVLVPSGTEAQQRICSQRKRLGKGIAG